MTMSRSASYLSKPKRGERIPLGSLTYARARAKNKAHSKLLKLFAESGIQKAELAAMLGKDPAQLTRWLGGPGNLTIDTISDIVFALNGGFVELEVDRALDRPRRNHFTSASTGEATRTDNVKPADTSEAWKNTVNTRTRWKGSLVSVS